MVNEYIKQYREILKSKSGDIESLKAWLQTELADLKGTMEPTYNPDKATLKVIWPERFYFLQISFMPKEGRWVCIFAAEKTTLIQKDYGPEELEILKEDFAKTIATLYA